MDPTSSYSNHTTLSAVLLTTPIWSDILHIFSATMQLIGVTSGAIIGVVTLYRMWRHRNMK